MNGYLSYLVAGEHVSDLMSEASRRRLRREAKRSRARRAALPEAAAPQAPVSPSPLPRVDPVYCVRAAAPARRAAA
jgi:hypothetical protein